ncbi:MAG: hypothetical protein ACREX0_17215 [Noviherbaspirillum sp.]
MPATAMACKAVPASLKFKLDAGHDFLPKGQPSTKGMACGWNGRRCRTRKPISCTRKAQPKGWALMTYQSPAQITKLLQ